MLILGVAALQIWFTRLDPSQAPFSELPAPQEGFPAPDFTLTTIQGDELTLSDFRGTAVMVNIWASWCGPCRSEMPAMQEVYETYPSQEFTILAVNATDGDSRKAAKDFVTKHQLTFPILLDTTGEVGDRYRVHSLPTSFFIDRRGVIDKVVIGGPLNVKEIEDNVQPLLKGGR